MALPFDQRGPPPVPPGPQVGSVGSHSGIGRAELDETEGLRLVERRFAVAKVMTPKAIAKATVRRVFKDVLRAQVRIESIIKPLK